MATQPLLVLDGGNGHMLRRNGVKIQGPIGSMERFLNVALANRDQPEIVVRTHLDYLRAGARVITTNSYSCVPAAVSLSSDSSPELVTDLIHMAGKLAHEACDTFLKEQPSAFRPIVAGDVPPLHESYRADRVSDDDAELKEGYAMIVKNIAPYADVLLCETMSSVREGLFAAEAASRAGKPVWISWTLAEDTSGNLRSGEPIEEAVEAVRHLENIQAMLINCSFPATTEAAIPRLRKAAPPGVALGAYANGFRTVKASGGGDNDATGGKGEYNEDLTPDAYAEEARKWMGLGVTIVGGCCGVFPEHISAVSRQLTPQGKPLK